MLELRSSSANNILATASTSARVAAPRRRLAYEHSYRRDPKPSTTRDSFSDLLETTPNDTLTTSHSLHLHESVLD